MATHSHISAPAPAGPDDGGDVLLVRGQAARGFAGLTMGEEREADCVAVSGGRVVGAGRWEGLARHWSGRVRRTVRWPGRLILPGLVNAHCHLDLTGIGPRAHTGSFVSWVRMIMEARPSDAAQVGAAVSRGVAQTLASGVEYVGDIGGLGAGDRVTLDTLAASGLGGVYFAEVIARDGERAAAALGRLERLRQAAAGVSVGRGVSPHAPYSTGRAVYEACTREVETHGGVLSTHLAETPEESLFVAEAAGPFRTLLESLGRWGEAVGREYGQGLSPVQWMEPWLRRSRWLLAHCNYVDEADIDLLSQTGASVVYCPIASEYFGHTNHRYRQMLEAGVNVCLGTDSVVCQPPAEREPQPLGVLSQMRRLYQRDRADPALLLRMATTHGRVAVGCEAAPIRLLATVRISPDDTVDALTQALSSREPVRAVALAGEVERWMHLDTEA